MLLKAQRHPVMLHVDSLHGKSVLSRITLQVRGPLTALRTLGSILVPRLRQKEGQEIDRDVAQGILTQVCPSCLPAFVMNRWPCQLKSCFQSHAACQLTYNKAEHDIVWHLFTGYIIVVVRHVFAMT